MEAPTNGVDKQTTTASTEKKKVTKHRNLSIQPIVLKGHERPITVVKYNRDGDLLFTASKDAGVCLWYSDTGERIGTYKSHLGAVSSVDVSSDTRFLLTGSADQTVWVWKVETGEELFQWKINGRVQSVAFDYGSSRFLVAYNSASNQASRISIYNFLKDHPKSQNPKAQREIILKQDKENIKFCTWGYLNEYILASTNTGFLYIYDPETGAEKRPPIHDHTGPINSIIFNRDQTLFVTCGDDCRARLYDSKEFKLLKTYQTQHPVNSAAFSPIREHIILGGGQHAMGAALLGNDTSQFSSRFFHMIDGEELAAIKGHFGPINSLAFNPDGKSFTSGSEDGNVRIHPLAETDYLNGALEEAADAQLEAELAALI